MGAVAYQNVEAVNTLLGVPPTRGLDLERAVFFNNATQLNMVRFMFSA